MRLVETGRTGRPALAAVLGAGLATMLGAAGWSGPAQAEDEELCGRIAGAICNGGELAPCFRQDANWDYVPPICTGFVQTLIEMEREAGQQGQGGVWGAGRQQTGAGGQPGMSFGGVLREGPGMEFGRFGSLSEGDWISVIEPTGIWMDDYQWFVVDSPVGQGFHWGGIFCTYDVVPEGVLQAC